MTQIIPDKPELPFGPIIHVGGEYAETVITYSMPTATGGVQLPRRVILKGVIVRRLFFNGRMNHRADGRFIFINTGRFWQDGVAPPAE